MAIQGARQTGKSYLACTLLQDLLYTRFCVAKGFTDIDQSSLNDLSFSEWTTKNASVNAKGVVLLNDEGFIIQIQEDASKKLRVIDSVTCK